MKHADLNVEAALRRPFKLSMKKKAALLPKLGPASGYVFLIKESEVNAFRKLLQPHVPAWQLKDLVADNKASGKPILQMTSEGGPVWILRYELFQSDLMMSSHNRIFNQEGRGAVREIVGTWARASLESLSSIYLHLGKLSAEETEAVFHGLTLAQYSHASTLKKGSGRTWEIFMAHESGVADMAAAERGMDLGVAQNLSRHLVNLPPDRLNPKAYAELLKSLFSKKGRGVSVEVWGPTRLLKEKCGLLFGVGQGSKYGSHLVHIRYRPAGQRKHKKPIAFVGKGVTFDTGGLDIKPSSGMRLMKKDMGGSATVVGLAYFVVTSKLTVPCDFYLAITENAVSRDATRPSDILVGRNGMRVEIHNTDAEGRVAMADALDLAVTQKAPHDPEIVVDVATLTGAMRVSLGLDVAGYFSNDDDVAAEIESAGLRAGEYTWRMPLVPKYRRMFSSGIADMANAAESGYGGAITAALFLEKFVRNKPWVHFDVMAWNLGADGALSDGGNGQALPTLAEFLLGRA